MKTLNAPTRVRWMVFSSLFALCTVNYIDRAVISICMPAIEEELHFGPELVGVILSAFFWGYTVMQIPSGWVADRFGPGKTILGSGLLWGFSSHYRFSSQQYCLYGYSSLVGGL